MTQTIIMLITNGVVKNLQKTPYFLRIPTEVLRVDRVGETLIIPPNQCVEIEYRDWKLIEPELITKDRAKVLQIIKYPQAVPSNATTNVYITYNDLPANPPLGTIIWAQWGYYQGLFYWDSVRNDWLGENQITRTWSSASDSAAITVGLTSNSDDTFGDNDVISHVPITITMIAGSQVNTLAAGTSTKFSINVKNIVTDVVTKDMANVVLTHLGDKGVVNGNLNAKIDGGVILSASRIGTGVQIVRPALTLWYRERLTP